MASESVYRRLQRHLDRMPVGFPATESGVEIRILERLFTSHEAEIALELSAIPEPAAKICKRFKSGVTLAALTQELDAMAGKGIILRLPAKPDPLYAKMIFAVGLYERQLPNLTADFARDSFEYLHGRFGEAFHTRKTTQMRTVPVNRTVPVERCVGTPDDIRAYVESSPGPFAKINCICRTGMDLLGQPCKQTQVRENCLIMGVAAAEVARSGMGHAITREEMLGMLDLADKEGLVLQPQNTRDPMFVCCCCGCCCGVLTSAKRLPGPAEYFSANYYAEVDPDTCQSCGTCESRCQMDAITNQDDGRATVDRSRCIGCGLCLSTCPSGALRLEKKEATKLPADDMAALYMTILKERYGPWGMAKIAGRRLLGMKF
jgi:Na+-translocating ferredoxin:NAD+ oxidoreductase subunit B